jgi:hypothetical protein
VSRTRAQAVKAPHRPRPAHRPSVGPKRESGGTVVSRLLDLQRDAGNAAVTGLVVQRKVVAHTEAKKVPGILAAEPLVAGYVGKDGGAVPTIEAHPQGKFRDLYVEHAMKQGHTKEKAVGDSVLTNAFTDLDAGVIYLNESRGDPGTAIHEALHLHSSKGWVSDHHPKINEGVTEVFTRRVCEKSSIPRGDDYQDHFNAIEALLKYTTVEALAKAYFQNDTSQVAADLCKLRANLWTDWQIAMIKSMLSATALLKSLER